MLRSTMIVMGAAVIAGAGFAQQRLDSSDLHPVTVAPQYAGTYNWQTKRWVPTQKANQLRASSLTVYNNSCTFTGGGFYSGNGSCAAFIDEGRIPGGFAGNNPPGATVDNLIDFFEIAYCTSSLNGTVDLELAFYNNLGGGCVGGVSPNPPPLSTTAQGYFDFGAAAGFPAPGSATAGAFSCWTWGVTLGNAGFCMQSDGDGIFDNNLNLDQFSWVFDLNNTGSQGPLLRGEPLSSAVGGCTYNIPCGSDYWSTATACGHGLDTEDIFWINVDRDRAGTPVTGGLCPSAPGSGTACYWFGGYPGGPGTNNPFASFYLKLGSAGQCSGCNGNPTSYCTAGTTANGCNATVALSGVPSPGNAAPCNIVVNHVEGQQNGIIFYGMTQVAVPWSSTSSSFLCVKSPLERLGIGFSGGTAGACDGTLSADVNAYWATNPSALGNPIYAGEVLHFQGWFRDPPSPKTTSLSDALTITICP